MGSYAATKHTTWLDGYDLTGDLNNLDMAWSCAELDATVYNNDPAVTSPGRLRKGGLETVETELEGFYFSDVAGAAPDPEIHTGLGTVDAVLAHSVSGAETDTLYAYVARKLTYEKFGEVGELAPFTLGAMSTVPSGGGGAAVRGQVAAAKQSKSSTGVLGSVLNLGAPTATQFVYAGLHVFSAGTTITVQVQSDDSAGFGTPTTRATIGPVTARGATWLARVAGPFSGETHWRLNISAITGTFQVAGWIAVDK